uniref:C2 domain-containing protein n=1 Tax=Mesocestoides corti TaxID=53468 RepID=A0A5K3EYP6_MESCO
DEKTYVRIRIFLENNLIKAAFLTTNKFFAESRPSSQHLEDMYNSWAGKGNPPPSGSRESLTLANLADRKSGAQTPKSQHSPPGSVGPTSIQEFAEESYPKGYNWQPQSNQTPQDAVILPANTTIHTHIKVDYKVSDLIIKVNKVVNAPGEDRAGSQSYQVHIAVLGLKKKKRWHSRIIPAPDPVFDETAVFKGMTPDELAKAALRLRLYGCKKLRRHFIFAESIVAFAALNLRSGEADFPFALASKVGSESVVDSDSDTGDNLSRLHASRMGSRLSLHSRASKRSSISRMSNSQSRGPPSVATTDLPELETARQVAEGREANWPELLCGLAYNVTTKRLNIHVLRASRLKIPETSLRTPS